MRRRLILFVIAIVVISVAAAAFISAIFSINNYLDEKNKVLVEYARIIADNITSDYEDDTPKSYPEYADRFAFDTGYRITIIDKKGRVLADSSSGESYKDLENHRNREEVKEALENGKVGEFSAGEARRESSSFGKTYIYSAVACLLPDSTDNSSHRQTDTVIIRLAMEIDYWGIAKDQVIGSTVIASLIGIAVAIILVLIYSKKLLMPVKEMERDLSATIEKNIKAENIRKEFLANVTHELKTPLTSISGFVETIMEAENLDDEKRTKFLNIVYQETERLSRLIDDMLIISDIESGRASNTNEDIDVNKAIEEVIDTLKPLAHAKEIQIEFDSQYEMYLGGSADRFKQLMLNLLENAIKYSDEDTTVSITANKLAEEQKIVISVADEGIGIKDADIERLFERFYRVDKSRSKKAGGTGLGLAIVKHIASLFDAEIKVESKLGQGSLFTLIFPTK
jgi:two-component system phosphate regulon sensor histidine kinase PhoR